MLISLTRTSKRSIRRVAGPKAQFLWHVEAVGTSSVSVRPATMVIRALTTDPGPQAWR